MTNQQCNMAKRLMCLHINNGLEQLQDLYSLAKTIQSQ